MTMNNGVERITERILSEAQARADAVLADARAECERIHAEADAHAQQLRAVLSEKAEQEGKELVSRAKAEAANDRRNLLLQTQSELMDAVFDGALEWAHRLETEKYEELLAGLLCAALLEQADAENAACTSDAEDASSRCPSYVVVMNSRDRDRYGAAVLEATKKRLRGRVSDEMLAGLRLAERAVSVDGGLILRCGDVEVNCTLPLLFAQLRRELEAEVGHALFDVKGSL